MKRTRVLLADDHPLTLEGLRTFLDHHVDCVGAVADGRAVVEAARRLRPELIILDITMPLLNGIDAARQIRESQPEVKLLFVTMHVNPAYLEAALNVGATGYVLKSAAREEILKAIDSVMKGNIYVTPSLSSESLQQFSNPSEAAAAIHLSEREREVLQLIAEGRAAKEMAHILHISMKTIDFHRANIKRKLGLQTTAELTKYALEQGLI